MEKWFGADAAGLGFVMFNREHWAALIVSLAVSAAIVIWRKELRRGQVNRIGRWLLVGVLVSFEITLQLWYVINGEWALRYSLPLQLCSITLLLSAVMVARKSRTLYEPLYFLGIGGALQALLTPSLDFAFPHMRFIHFFAAHAAIIAASIWMTAVEELRPTLRSVGRAMMWLNGIALIVYPINELTGSNYMFLSRKPPSASILDLLAPWPWYILQLELIAAGCFLLLWLPARAKGRKKAAVSGND
ncbi:TIGR02206 family membrane protein [Paenibacillus turpanensis]|uniref:YwaF family protein n=1 Tax=Paenibacillus turpanensis TaxID=2689078 RepID=UPI001408224D|nr:TIGR02206 family membrane protein [Paenibacillus turpanensis]